MLIYDAITDNFETILETAIYRNRDFVLFITNFGATIFQIIVQFLFQIYKKIRDKKYSNIIMYLFKI
jgi:hypothetical protein